MWRSVLYPTDWKPGVPMDAEGHMIQDFSYAGYRTQGLYFPQLSFAQASLVIDATSFGADRTGSKDSTDAIQAAINASCAAPVPPGTYRIVYLPSGTYQLSKRGDACLHINGSYVVLRGDGPGKTMLFNNDIEMRGADIIKVGDGFKWPTKGGVSLTADANIGDLRIHVANTAGIRVGDWVTIYTPISSKFLSDIGADGPIGWDKLTYGPVFVRQVTHVGTGTVDVDVPIRFPLKAHHGSKLVHVSGPIMPKCGIGLENFSIGNRMNPRTEFEPNGYNASSCPSYSAHGCNAICFSGVVDCWMNDVRTYKPSVNSKNVHILSNGFAFMKSARLTVVNCSVEHPEYTGGGGNGYGFSMQSQEVLIAFCQATAMRHGFTHATPFDSGNVVTGSTDANPICESDWHMRLSPASLFDNTTLINSGINASFRPYGSAPVHGFTTSESVIWNTRGSRIDPSRALVSSKQLGNGYVVGVSCAGELSGKGVGNVNYENPHVTYNGHVYSTAPIDHVEGIGKAETLEPQSLYFDQFKRRSGR